MAAAVPIQPAPGTQDQYSNASFLGAPTSPQPLSVSPGIPTQAYNSYQPHQPQQDTYPAHPVQTGFQVSAAAPAPAQPFAATTPQQVGSVAAPTPLPVNSHTGPVIPGTTQGNVAPATGAKGQVHVDKVKGLLAQHGGKNGVWLGNQIQGQVNALATVPIVGDINSNGAPVDYHVFKAGGLFSKDDVVTTENKNNVLYYLDFPRTWRHSWNLTLRHQGKEGPLVATLNKGAYGFTQNDIEIVMANGWKTVLAKPSFISKNHEFIGFDGTTHYKWKGDGMLSTSMTLIELTTGKVAATWQSSYSYGKDGSLKISPAWMQMQDLIVATALAMEEWRREEEEKGGGSKTGTLKMGMHFLNKATGKK